MGCRGILRWDKRTMPKDFQWLADRWMVHYGGVCELRYHFVWCPKYRRKVLVDNVAQRLQELLHEAVEQFGGKVLELAIQPDHLHLFVQMGTPHLSPAQIAFHLKGYTSRTLRSEFPELRRRLPTLWSRSSYVGPVGQVSQETVERYIASQRGR